MTRKIHRDVLEKKTREQSNSAREARAVFLYLVLDLRPDLVKDLWTKALKEFAWVVAHRFRRELVGEQALADDSGLRVLVRLLDGALLKVEASNDSTLADLRILALFFAPFTRIKLDQLEDAFPDWDSLKGTKQMRALSKAINDWCVHWNLDTGWCRDHALSVLRHWIADDALKWTYLSPGAKSQLERKGWQRATSSRIWDVQALRFYDALSILGGNLNPFEFRWREASFDAPGWNYLKERESDWRSRTRLKFSIWLSEKELEKLRLLEDETRLDELTPAEVDRALSWRHGALTRFEAGLKKYLGRMRESRGASRSQHNLIPVDDKPKLQEHIGWAVRYQVGREGLAQIASSIRAEEGGIQPSTVSRAVEDVLSLIGLPKRSDAKPGRKHGSGKGTPRILRNLGH